jgi:hypothetical protein
MWSFASLKTTWGDVSHRGNHDTFYLILQIPTSPREAEGFAGRRLDSPNSNFSEFTSTEQKGKAIFLDSVAIRKTTL